MRERLFKRVENIQQPFTEFLFKNLHERKEPELYIPVPTKSTRKKIRDSIIAGLVVILPTKHRINNHEIDNLPTTESFYLRIT